MVKKLDGTTVLMLSEKGCFGYLEIQGPKRKHINLYYSAIYQYENDDKVYLFLCSENMEVEADWDFDRVEEAIFSAESRSSSPITWIYPNKA